MSDATPTVPQPAMPDYSAWRATCDTVHAHSQVLGKLAGALAAREPDFGHLALRLTARGMETRPLPCPDGSGVIVVTLDLQLHEVVFEHTDGRTDRIPLTPNRPVSDVTHDVLAAARRLAGDDVAIDMTPQEVDWTVPFDEDDEHATYDTAQIATYFAAATHAGTVLAAIRAAHEGHATPINAWWGSFDIAVSLTVDGAGNTPDREMAIGWWPGDARYPRPAWYAYISPPPDGVASATLPAGGGRWYAPLGEFLLDWADAAAAADPVAAELGFANAIRALAHG